MHEFTFWQEVWLKVIEACMPTIAGIGAWWAINSHGKKMDIKIDDLGIKVDGRLTELVEAKDQQIAATAISAEAIGVLKEKERHRP